MLIDDYLEYQETYQKKYGDKTIILMQVGSFFEAYAIDSEQEKINVENLYYICDIMNIQISRKNKSILKSSRSNPLMAGFPLPAIDKFIQILMNNHFTVVLIEQVTEPPEPERKITNIFSPGTQINYCPSEETSNLISVYIDTVKDLKRYQDTVCIGLSVIDLTTGKSIVYECFSAKDDSHKAYDEVFRFIQSHNPREIIFTLQDCPLTPEKLVTYLEIQRKTYHFVQGDQIEKAVGKLSYQKSFLEKVYSQKNKTQLSIHEYLDLENKIYGTVSFIHLLQFAYEHNESVIQKIEEPRIWNSNQYLILTQDSISQLNVVDNSSNSNLNNKFNSLLGIVNNASTALGKRYLREQLLNPINSTDTLKKRYRCVREMLERTEEDKNKFRVVEEYLKKIMDIERLHRRMGLGVLQPADFSNLDLAYQNIISLVENKSVFSEGGELSRILPKIEEIEQFRCFIQEYTELFDLEEIGKYHLNNVTDSFFNTGKIEEIDTLAHKISILRTRFDKIAHKLSHYIESGSQFIKVEFTDKDGYYLQTTKKRGETLRKSLNKMGTKKMTVKDSEKTLNLQPSDFELKFLKDRTKINSDLLTKMSYQLRGLQASLQQKTTEVYLEKLDYFYTRYHPILKKISLLVAELDFYKSNAKTATLYGYVEPVMVPNPDSFVNIKNMRHPIIERINTASEYVPNDVIIGLEETSGMLLYGCNAVGKSSLMKAIGLNIIMAQAGMFVAASEFIYQPFDYIFTRINDNDNLFKGQSSFAVEMSELRSILKRSNNRSMVLGDELCSGTESVSAQSIFAASVIKLSERNVNFIFATHLHELYKMTEVQELENVKSYHLKVIFDEETKTLVYDRKLEEGNGPTIYGLEVCKAMDLDQGFLSLANSLRKKIIHQEEKVVDTHTSQYNSNLFMDMCGICNKKANETHHIKEQHLFNENKMLDHLPQNNLSNLVPLCEECHLNVHHGNLIIRGYQDTTKGIKLDFEFREKKLERKGNKKYDEEQIVIIKKYRNIPNMNYAKACRLLDDKFQIKISSQTLKKIWSDIY